MHADAPRAGQRDREGHVTARQRHHDGQPLHQGPVRLEVRAEKAGNRKRGSRKRGSRKRGSRKRGSRKPAAMTSDVPSRERAFVRLAGEASALDRAEVAEEVPVAFVYSGRPHVVMMCTPDDLEDLAYGFSLTEGIIQHSAEIESVEIARHARGVEMCITIPADAAARLSKRTRAIAGRTGCGLCGVEGIA